MSRFDSYLEARQEIALCLLSDSQGEAEHHDAQRYIRARFVCEAKQQRELFTTAVFKQLGSKMCLEVEKVREASPELQLDSGLHHRSETQLVVLKLGLNE